MQHGDKLCVIIKSIDADEVWVVMDCGVPDGASLNLLWPFKIPPEGGKVAVLTSSIEDGITVGIANGCVWDEVSNGARLGDSLL